VHSGMHLLALRGGENRSAPVDDDLKSRDCAPLPGPTHENLIDTELYAPNRWEVTV
jgi:hypothetical protein